MDALLMAIGGFVVVILVWLIIGKLITNAWHKIESRNRLLKAQAAFLEKLCVKMGVSPEEIKEINEHTKYKSIKLE